MKRIIFVFALSLSFSTVFGQKYISKNGHISFNASTPLEDINAHNQQAASILDAATGDIVFNALMKSFEFKVALMQEHFNENYIESDKYPKASFKGKIANISSVNFSKDGNYNVDVSGDLTLHGVTKPISTKGEIRIKNGIVSAISKFVVQTADYNIKIPKIVEGKIAKEVEVNVDLTYAKM
jgi:polyisoprenoid-binding protein YceI